MLFRCYVYHQSEVLPCFPVLEHKDWIEGKQCAPVTDKSCSLHSQSKPKFLLTFLRLLVISSSFLDIDESQNVIFESQMFSDTNVLLRPEKKVARSKMAGKKVAWPKRPEKKVARSIFQIYLFLNRNLSNLGKW